LVKQVLGFSLLFIWQLKSLQIHVVSGCDLCKKHVIKTAHKEQGKAITHKSVAHQLQGEAGPGGCDASFWHDFLLHYGSSSVHLHDSVAALCHRLCNSIIPLDDVRALMASCLITLNKYLGVRQIGIGETLHRVIGKAVCLATHLDATLVCGSDQLCAGLQAGIEGGHSCHE